MGFLASKNKFQAQNLAGSTDFQGQNFADQIAQARALQQQGVGMAGESRGQQQQLNQQLLAQALGQAPSLAQAQLQQATNQQNAQASSTLGSQRGINPALAARLIAQQQAANNQGMAGQAATAGIQERLAAQGTLAGALAQQRQQDIGQAGLGLSQEALQQQAQAGQNQQMLQQSLGVQGINAGVAAQNTQNANSFISGGLGGLGSAVGGLLGLSSGGKVPGQAEVSGDDKSNDTVPAMLSPGEIVVPRSAAKSPDKAKAFVEAIAKGRKSSTPKQFGSFKEVVAANQEMHKRVKALEDLAQHYAEGGEVSPNAEGEEAATSSQVSFEDPSYDAYFNDAMQRKDRGDVGATQFLANPPTGAVITPTAPDTVAPENQVLAPGTEAEQAGPPKPGLEQQLADIEGFGKRSIEEQQQAAEAQSKAGAQTYSSLGKNLHALQVDTDKRFNDLHNESTKLYQDVLTSKVDPHRYYSSMSTGQKIGASIALLLGGIAGRGQGNIVLDTINKSIDRDVEAQKADIANKHSLFNMNLARTKNVLEASLMTRNQLMTAAQAQIAKAAAQFQGGQSKAIADAMRAKLGEEVMNRNMQLAQFQAKQSLMGGTADINPELLSKEDRERVVRLPSGKQALARSSKDAEEVTKQVDAIEPVMGLLDKLDELGPSAAVPGTAAYNRAKGLIAVSIPQVNHAFGLTRLSEEDIKNLKETIFNPTKITQFLGGRQRSQALREGLTDKLTSTLKGRLEGGYQQKRPSFGVPYEAK